MWTVLQLAVAGAVGFWLLSLGETNKREIAIAGFVAAFCATYALSYVIDFLRRLSARSREPQQERPSAE